MRIAHVYARVFALCPAAGTVDDAALELAVRGAGADADRSCFHYGEVRYAAVDVELVCN